MTDSLRAKLTDTCKSVISLNLSEAEQDTYPYAVYDMTTVPLMDKDGVYGFSGDTTIRIVGPEKQSLEVLRAGIESAILSGMNDSAFTSKRNDTTKECVDGMWIIELTYTLKQYADWVKPVEQTNSNTE